MPVSLKQAILYNAFQDGQLHGESLIRWLGLPHESDCPSPGDGSSMDLDAWGDWATKHGFEPAERTKHAYCWVHPITKCRIALSSSPGDTRSYANQASDFRNAVRAHNAVIVEGVSTLLRVGSDKSFDEEDGARHYLRTYDWAPAAPVVAHIVRGMERHDEKFDCDIARLRRPLTLLQQEFGFAWARSLRALNWDSRGITEAEAGRLAEVVRTWGSGPVPGGETLAAALTELLRGKRDEAQKAKDAARAERDAERAAKDAARTERNRPRTQVEIIQAAFDQRRAGLVNELDRLSKDMAHLAERVRCARDNVPAFTLPTTMADDAALIQAKQEAETLRETLAAAQARESVREAELAQLRGAQTELPALQAQLAHAKTFAQLVQDTVSGAANLNPFQLVVALQALAAEAATITKGEPQAAAVRASA